MNGADEKLKEAFTRMESLLAARESEVAPTIVDCMCDGASKVYFKMNDHGEQVLAVCPACNPRTHCEQCGGTGHHRHFNLVTLNDDLLPFQCECTSLEKRVELFNEAHIPVRYQKAQFGSFELKDFSEAQANKMMTNHALVYEFCSEIDEARRADSNLEIPNFLVLAGPVGTGKTFLGVAALRRLILEFGFAAKYVDFQKLLQQLKECYNKKTSEEEVLRPLRQTPVLLIDELGKGRAESEWEMEKLDDLINSRYNEKKVTILTTNYLPPDLFDAWQKSMSEEEKKYYKGSSSELVGTLAYLDSKQAGPINESFWTMTLPERIGARMYDRIFESADLIDFIGIPSLRRLAAQPFLKAHFQKQGRRSD